MTRLPLPTGFDFLEEPTLTPHPSRIHAGVIVDTGRRKRVPRTLQEAFPLSEGYRHAAGRIAEDGSLDRYTPPARGLRALVTPDRVSWAIVFALALFAIRWAWLAPKVGS